jgi:hypothetical protein
MRDCIDDGRVVVDHADAYRTRSVSLSWVHRVRG